MAGGLRRGGPPAEKVSRAGQADSPPRLIRNEEPPYTEAARRARIEGLVMMRVLVRRDGSVGEVLRGLGYGLDESAVETVKNGDSSRRRKMAGRSMSWLPSRSSSSCIERPAGFLP